MRKNTKSFEEIREYLDTLPIIDTHEHFPGTILKYDDIFDFLLFNYYQYDLYSAGFLMEDKWEQMRDLSVSLDERIDTFLLLYERSKHTSYAKALEYGLMDCWGVSLTREGIKELWEKFKSREQSFYYKTINRLNIKSAIADIQDPTPYVLFGNKEYSSITRFAFRFSCYHELYSFEQLKALEGHLGDDIYSFDKYLGAVESVIDKAVKFGCVCFKDHSAYRRKMDYKDVDYNTAKAAFDKLVAGEISENEAILLDDYVMNFLLNLAGEKKLPVQIHTGHMARKRQNVEKANAVYLTETLERHKNTAFALMHGNWPYMGDYLYLGKNYDNCFFDLCWLHAIDPYYSIELIKRAIVTVPHTKIFAFGGDTRTPELLCGYLKQAKDVVACAMSELVDDCWVDVKTAKEICVDLFYNNPKNFYKL